ncbi:peptide chain release factor N(5)-glutamine methyltransferase [Anaerorhabdus sp.]|jgi:release factor glutamine methyltransferase|uniref:peptide chain release factor N(5)-glutamine methyltransferase n=1 Tax=Anaerorhabdus sp. TaxID=1872524 RepID=UPI002FC5B2D6
MPTFKQLIHDATEQCMKIDLPEQTALTYLVELTQQQRVDLYMNMNLEVPKDVLEKFNAGLVRILNHEPMQHVLGYSWFYGYKFNVNSNVLIPRPETEELVSYILSRVDEMFPNQNITAVDIGTGSGAIAIAVANEEKHINMYATDISVEAIEVAKENAKINEAQVEFLVGDMLQPIIDKGIKVDVLISNPPYIPSKETLESSVVDYEPHVALFGGDDGLKFYRTIFENCKKIVKEKSFMAFEMGWDQRISMLNLVHEYLPNAEAEVLQDINGKDRMLFVYFK